MMISFGKIKKLNLREIWSKESSDFTPWLADNIGALGESLGMELELETREASVGDFSLDLLAKDLGTGGTVIIENQLTPTDHDHLGKLLTYAAGFGASTVVWVAESIRDEHRQVLEWLNQRTDSDTQFFGVVVEVLQIDDSNPAYNFKPVIFPNEWQKSKRRVHVSSKAEAYRSFFQALIDDLRENHRFTGARVGQPQNWYAFSSGFSGIPYSAVFAQGGRARVEVYIDQGDADKNKSLFDDLFEHKETIESECQTQLQWERLEDRRASRIAIYRDGSIEDSDEELRDIHSWMIENLLTFKKVFVPKIKAGLKRLR
ncbi:DUF4268 domain-containing protein [Acidobacteria bacterium AH-259-O06]|nr:DUF4268 domain-containing protein [Acidobacteria bacterium AH-259-O06]